MFSVFWFRGGRPQGCKGSGVEACWAGVDCKHWDLGVSG